MLKRFIIACSVLFWVSCSKNGSADNDKQAPAITIATPTSNQIFTGAQTIHITGLAADDTKIAEMHFHIYNNTTSALLIDIHRFPDIASLNFDETFTTQAGIQYKIQVLAIDKSGNQGTATVLVSCN